MATYESVMRYDGLKGNIVDMEEAAGTVLEWYENDLVKGNGSGLLDLAAAAATKGKIAGIAQARATGAINTHLEVELIELGIVYVVRAGGGTSTTGRAYVHESFDLNYTAGGHYVDVGATTNQEVLIVGFHPGDAVGTDGGRYLVTFNATVFAESGA